jgi:hypothetical protein
MSHAFWELVPSERPWSQREWRCIQKVLSARLNARKVAVDSFEEHREDMFVSLKWKKPASFKSVEAFFRSYLSASMCNWMIQPAKSRVFATSADDELLGAPKDQEGVSCIQKSIEPRCPSSLYSMRVLYHNSENKFVGERAEFSIIQGKLSHDVLRWLRADDCFSRSLEDWSMMYRSQDVSAAVSKRQRVEKENKVELIGVVEPLSSFMGQRQPSLLPLRFRAFVKAFKNVNQEALALLGVLMKTAFMVVSDDEIKENGKHLRDSSPADWIMVGGSLQLMKADARSDPVHFDGGASLLHCGLTLFGNRVLHINQAESKLPLLIRNDPGHIYMGCLAACSHFVQHLGESCCDDLLRIDGFGDAEVALMLRCGTFKHAFGVSGKSIPKPHVSFRISAGVVGQWLRIVNLYLPTLSMCEEAVNAIA